MRSKLSFLQHLGEESSLSEHYNKVGDVMDQPKASETSVKMHKSTNSSHRSVESQRNQENMFQETIQTMRPISTDLQTRSKEYLNQKCLGLPERKKSAEMGTKTVRNHGGSSNSLLEITKSSSNGYKLPEPLLWVSQQASEITSSEAKPSTSTQCSHHCTIFLLLRRTLDAWDILKSPLEDQSQPKGSKRVVNGPALGTPPLKRLNLLSHTQRMRT